MNPWALFFLILAVGMLPGALYLGGLNGLSLLGVLFTLLTIAIQVARPRGSTPQRKARR